MNRLAVSRFDWRPSSLCNYVTMLPRVQPRTLPAKAGPCWLTRTAQEAGAPAALPCSPMQPHRPLHAPLSATAPHPPGCTDPAGCWHGWSPPGAGRTACHPGGRGRGRVRGGRLHQQLCVNGGCPWALTQECACACSKVCARGQFCVRRVCVGVWALSWDHLYPHAPMHTAPFNIAHSTKQTRAQGLHVSTAASCRERSEQRRTPAQSVRLKHVDSKWLSRFRGD